jgi:hypothetical protein
MEGMKKVKKARMQWSLTDGPQTAQLEKALEAINGKTIYDETRGDFTCHVGVHVPPREPRKKALWDLFSTPERIDRDLELAKRLVSKLDQDFRSDVDGVAKIVSRVHDIRDKDGCNLQLLGLSVSKKEKKSREYWAWRLTRWRKAKTMMKRKKVPMMRKSTMRNYLSRRNNLTFSRIPSQSLQFLLLLRLRK